MNYDTQEKYKRIIEVLGEEKVDDMYYFLGSEKISFATLKRIMHQNKLRELAAGKKPITQVAKENGVSAKTIYRLLK